VRILGIGLVALDVVVDERDGERVGSWAGGSCGNVLSILGWFGWHAAAVSRLDSGLNSELVRADLARWNVDTRWLAVGDPVQAPVYVERLKRTGDGTSVHRFDTFCPECGGRLPGYQPVTRAALAPVVESLAEWDLLYIDRPSAGATLLAHEANERGIRVVFEPSARGSGSHLQTIARCADIVKYSSERLTAEDRDMIAAASPTLEIETFGARGLRYRRGGDWITLPAINVEVEDSAGAGDWTTAALLLALADGSRRLERIGQKRMHDALVFAQALAAWSCGFLGPRGAMEHHTTEEARTASLALLGGDRHTSRRRRRRPSTSSTWACVECS
jgi:sugar/nucleoside kinase (ribokinase family)